LPVILTSPQRGARGVFGSTWIFILDNEDKEKNNATSYSPFLLCSIQISS
jgi:hypothetical protein